MKFGHEYAASLEDENFQKEWKESAIPYGKLKKIIKKVSRELKENGLDIQRLLELEGHVNYDFDENHRPRLTVLYDENDTILDAKLSPGTVATLKRLAKEHNVSVDLVNTNSYTSAISRKSSFAADAPNVTRREVPLKMGDEFFGILQEHIVPIDKIREEQQKQLEIAIREVSEELAILVKPHKFSKSDMYRWRQILAIYLDAAPYFATTEQQHGIRTSAEAKKQLEWFQNKIRQEGIEDKFKLPASKQAFSKFCRINAELFNYLKYQELNHKALHKILKKFDKRTHLHATEPASRLIMPHFTMPASIAKAVCSEVSTSLVKVTPQLDDYLCPVCLGIIWRPIKMKCQHIFCIKCTIQMQRQKRKVCPLCRGEVMLEADEDSIDGDLSKYLKKYFPKEVREKQIELETIAGREQFGPSYRHPSEGGRCTVM